MTITDKEYSIYSDQVYWLDPKHKDYAFMMKEGAIREFEGNKYKILKIQENSSTDGLQAMAVAPIDKKGKTDTSKIVIAYAGTNSSDFNDLETDLRTIGGFFDKTASPGFSIDRTPQRIAGQAESALAFATEIQRTYDNATITTTGHSLGEYLALLVAAENKWHNVGFNGPDPYDILSVGAKDWLKRNPGMLMNYRNRGDALGNNLLAFRQPPQQRKGIGA